MSSLPTTVRSLLTRRRQPFSIASYGMLIALKVAVVFGGAMLVATHFNSP